MGEHQIRVERTARYQLLGTPGAHVRRLWFVLHGYGQVAASMLRRCEPLAAADTLVVAPEALSRFYLTRALANHPNATVGASWMTRETRESEIADYVAYLDRLHAHLLDQCGSRPIETHVLGFSQGVATAVRWAVLGASYPPTQLVLWAASPPPELWTDAARGRLAETELVVAGGDADPYLSRDAVERVVERARAFGYRVRALEFTGAHEIPPDAIVKLVNG
jgi:predicted esterase